MASNKIVINGVTKIDLTADTVLIGDVASGKIFHLPDGTIGIGTLADGNNLEYGLTDGTLPMVGVAKVGQAELEA